MFISLSFTIKTKSGPARTEVRTGELLLELGTWVLCDGARGALFVDGVSRRGAVGRTIGDRRVLDFLTRRNREAGNEKPRSAG